MAIVNCKSCGKEISKNAKVCPHCGEPAPKKTSLTTWLVLILLIAIGVGMPNNSLSSVAPTPNKIVIAAPTPNKIAIAAPTPNEEAKNLVKLEKYEWLKGGFGNILIANFKIKNNSKYIVKDIEITCTHYAKSGTKIGSNEKTIYDSVKPSSNKEIKEFNMGFINTQVDRSGCEITDFQI